METIYKFAKLFLNEEHVFKENIEFPELDKIRSKCDDYQKWCHIGTIDDFEEDNQDFCAQVVVFCTRRL